MSTPEETLIKAATDGDLPAVEAALGTGVEVNVADEVSFMPCHTLHRFFTFFTRFPFDITHCTPMLEYGKYIITPHRRMYGQISHRKCVIIAFQ